MLNSFALNGSIIISRLAAVSYGKCIISAPSTHHVIGATHSKTAAAAVVVAAWLVFRRVGGGKGERRGAWLKIRGSDAPGPS